LSGARSGQHVHEREAFDELLLFDPPALSWISACIMPMMAGPP
jgi:hypothetical protein